MTLAAPSRMAMAALLILAGALTGCAGPAEPTSPAHSTWAIPTDPASMSAMPTATPTHTFASLGSDPASDVTRPLATDPAGSTDFPAATADLTNPTYDIDNIDRTNPAQVTWAYLTHRLSHSYTDPRPGTGLTAAAQYATPDLADQLTTQASAAGDDWFQLQTAEGTAIGTVTHLTTYVASGRARAIATWTLTVSTKDQKPRATAGLSSTVTLMPLPGTGNWQVAADGLAAPD